MEPDQVFDVLKNNLAPLLGDYVSKEFPAVVFEAINLGSDTPDEFNVYGLEILVSKTHRVVPSPVLGSRTRIVKELQILVRQWNSNQTTKEAVEQIVRLFPQSQVGATVPATREHLEQVNISLYSVELLPKATPITSSP